VTSQPELEPVGGPQTAHIGGRRPAILGALAVVGVLVLMVWIGVSGRSAAPAPAPPAAVLPSALETTPPPATAEPAPARPLEPGGPIAQASDDVFGVYAQFGFDQYITIMSEPEPGHLVGNLLMPLPIAEAEGMLVFDQFSSPATRGQPVFIEKWPINVQAVGVDTGEHLILNVSVPAKAQTDAPRPVNLGYRLSVYAQRDIRAGQFRIDVRIKDRRQIVGDDGLIGSAMAVVSADKPSYPVSDLPDIHRPDNGNQCRWYQPVPGTDEADCLSVPH